MDTMYSVQSCKPFPIRVADQAGPTIGERNVRSLPFCLFFCSFFLFPSFPSAAAIGFAQYSTVQYSTLMETSKGLQGTTRKGRFRRVGWLFEFVKSEEI